MAGMIRVAIVGLMLVAGAVSAAAQSRLDTRKMVCQQAINTVINRGAVVMTTGPGTYERIVADERFCLMGESAERAFAQTRDTPRCFVGYYCGQARGWIFD